MAMQKLRLEFKLAAQVQATDDENGQVRHFVIRKGLLLGHELIAPIKWVRQIDQGGVWFAVEAALPSAGS
jgi:hypothetical protein